LIRKNFAHRFANLSSDAPKRTGEKTVSWRPAPRPATNRRIPVEIRRGHVYLVDFNPRIKTKSGKLRPAVVLQSDLVSEAGYPSTVVVPTTTQLVENAGLLRLRLKRGVAGIERESDVLIGQLIAVANESFSQEIGVLPVALLRELERRVRIVLEL